jgi:hypothetical protein
MSSGRYWTRLSSVLTVAASWSMPPATRLPRSRLTCAHTPFHGVQVGSVGGQPDHGQPVAVRVDERAHRGAEVGVQLVPAQDDRGVQLMVGGGDQCGVVVFAEAVALTLASTMDEHPLEHPATLAGLETDQGRPSIPGRSP